MRYSQLSEDDDDDNPTRGDIQQFDGDSDATHGHVQEGRVPTATVLQTFGNLIKGYLGSGILGLPFAYSQGGLTASLLFMLAIGIIATHTMYLLVEVKRKIVAIDPSVVSFSDMALFLFGKWGAWLLDGVLIFTQFGFCCVYVVFVVGNTAALMCQWGLSKPNVFGTDACIPSVPNDIWVIPWFFIFMLLSWIRSLKNVAAVTIFSDLAIIFSIIIILIASGIQLNWKLSTDHGLDIATGIVPSTIAVMIGTGIYAFEGIGTVLPCETSMKEPEKFPKILFGVMGFSVINYMLFGLIPYLAFGASTSDQITFNLQQFAHCRIPNAPCLGNESWVVLSTLVTVLLIVAIMGTFPLQLFVVTDIAEVWMFTKWPVLRSRQNLYTNIFRTALVLLACIIAVSIPQFGLLMGLIGSLGGAALQFVFPAAFVLQLSWTELSLGSKSLYIFYLCFGALAGVLGFIQTVQQLVAA